jgi:ABC-type bacteriocin/lantibiotic exporter with double-glycine peptidase domain
MKAKILSVILVGILSCGCVSKPRHAKVIQVPFLPQVQTNHCGVTSLAMALDYYNIAYNLTNLVNEAYIPALNGSSLELLADTANTYGLHASIDSINVDDLQYIISQKYIPIIYLTPINNSTIGHFAVITGISSDSKKLRIHEADRPNHWVRSSNLNKRTVVGHFPSLILSIPTINKTK